MTWLCAGLWLGKIAMFLYPSALVTNDQWVVRGIVCNFQFSVIQHTFVRENVIQVNSWLFFSQFKEADFFESSYLINKN